MNTMDATPGAAEPAGPKAPETPAGVIARPGRGYDGWSGRYLHHAPGPSETARLIRETVTARSNARTRLSGGRRELIEEHPCGWEHLGARTAKDPQIKARRRPAPAGSCYCHTPDGQLRPGYLEQLLGMLERAEQAPVYSGEEFRKVMPRSSDPTDPVPQLMRSGENLPARVVYVFILRGESITIGVRDGADPREYLKAGEIGWSGQGDWEQIDAAATAIRARTTEDLARTAAARILVHTAKHLGELAHGEYALAQLHRGSYYDRHGAEAEALNALARTAGVDVEHLPEHLRSTGLRTQADLLAAAASALTGTEYPTA